MDPSTSLAISFVSGLAFAFLGNWMARRRGAHTLLWTLCGFLFPPLLLILKIIHWTPEPRVYDDEDGDGEGEGRDEKGRYLVGED